MLLAYCVWQEQNEVIVQKDAVITATGETRRTEVAASLPFGAYSSLHSVVCFLFNNE